MAERNIFQPLKTSMLYVKKFKDDDVTNEELYNHFKSYYPDGEIVSCKIGRGPNRKVAYVNYINHEQAATAIPLLNSTIFRNNPLEVKFSPGHRANTGSIIYIKNFDKSLDKDYLQELVSPYGNILVINLPTDSSGPAAVQYDSVESAQTAMKALYGKLIMNKRLYVYTNAKQPRDNENGNSIFLDIVPDHLSEHYLLETFSPFGSITRVRVYDDFPKGGLSGSVVFKDPASAAKAAEALTSGFNPNLEFVRRFWDRSHWERFQEEESNRLMLENQRMSCGTEEEASGTDLDGIYSKVISEVYQQLTILDAEKCRAMSQLDGIHSKVISEVYQQLTILDAEKCRAMVQLDGIYSRAISNIKHHVTLFEVEQFVRRFWDRSHWERFQEEESNRLMLENQRMSCGTEEEASGTDLDGIYSKALSEVKRRLTLLNAEQCKAMSQLDEICSTAISNIQHRVALFKVEQNKAMSQMEREYLRALKKRKVDEAFVKTKLDEVVDGDYVMDVEQSFTA